MKLFDNSAPIVLNIPCAELTSDLLSAEIGIIVREREITLSNCLPLVWCFSDEVRMYSLAVIFSFVYLNIVTSSSSTQCKKTQIIHRTNLASCIQLTITLPSDRNNEEI